MVGRDLNVYHAPSHLDYGLASPFEVGKGSSRDHESLFREYASYLGNVGGSEPSVGVVVDFEQYAEVFESNQKDQLRGVARKFLGIRDGDERQDDKFAEIDSTHTDDDARRVLVQFCAEGVAYIRIFLPNRTLPWDWLLVESYRVTRCLYSEAVRNIYGGRLNGQVTTGVTWPPEGIAPDGGRVGMLKAIPPSKPTGLRGVTHSWTSDFKADPWSEIRDFGVLALSRAGYKYHEERMRTMDVKILLELWFPPAHPLRGVLTEYPL